MARRQGRTALSILFACGLACAGPSCSLTLASDAELAGGADGSTRAGDGSLGDGAGDAGPADAVTPDGAGPDGAGPDGAGPDGGGTTYPATVLADGPVAYWRFEETTPSQIAADSSGNGHDGKYLGGVTMSVAGITGSHAVRFDGTSGAMSAGDTLGFAGGTAPFSIEAWASPDVVDAKYRSIVSKLAASSANPYFLDVQTPDGIDFGRMSNFCKSTLVLPTKTYSHLVAAYDGATSRLYVNGALVASIPSTTAMSSTSSPLTVAGAQPGPPTALTGTWFAGAIDEVAIYDKALSAARVTAHYTVGSGK